MQGCITYCDYTPLLFQGKEVEMSNRMLRPWVNSEKVNNLTAFAERFFVRLIMVVDDYGCFYADTRLLKANLFPLLLDTIREADLIRWMAECQKAGLVVFYESAGKKYLQIIDFKQRLDRAKHKFPVPDNESVVVVTDFPPEREYEVEEKENENALAGSNLFRKPRIPTFQEVRLIFRGHGGTEEMAKSFFEKYEGTGWYLSGSPIVNVSPLASKFITNWVNNEKKTTETNGKTPTAPPLKTI